MKTLILTRNLLFTLLFALIFSSLSAQTCIPDSYSPIRLNNDLGVTGTSWLGYIQTGFPLVRNTETDQNTKWRSFYNGNFAIGRQTPLMVGGIPTPTLTVRCFDLDPGGAGGTQKITQMWLNQNDDVAGYVTGFGRWNIGKTTYTTGQRMKLDFIDEVDDNVGIRIIEDEADLTITNTPSGKSTIGVISNFVTNHAAKTIGFQSNITGNQGPYYGFESLMFGTSANKRGFNSQFYGSSTNYVGYMDEDQSGICANYTSFESSIDNGTPNSYSNLVGLKIHQPTIVSTSKAAILITPNSGPVLIGAYSRAWLNNFGAFNQCPNLLNNTDLFVNGNAYSLNTAWTVCSDERIKTNITKLSENNYLDKVLLLSKGIVSFNYKKDFFENMMAYPEIRDDQSEDEYQKLLDEYKENISASVDEKSNKVYVGSTAQYLEEIGMGEMVNDEGSIKTVNYSNLIFYYAKAIDELNSKVEDLEYELNALKGKKNKLAKK